MAQTSALNTGVLYTDRRDFYLNPKETSELWPSVTPFTTMTAKMSTKKAPDPDFRMFEYRANWHNAYFLLNNGAGITLAASGSTNTVAFDTATGVHPNVGDVFDVWSSDDATYHGQVFVQAVTSTGSSGTLTTQTTVLSNNSVSDNAKFYLVGNAQEEGSGSPDAWSKELEVAYNTCQIFKTPLEITGTLLEMALRGKTSELARLRGEKMKEHQMKQELAFLLGRRTSGITSAVTSHLTGANSKYVRLTHGLLPILEDYNSGSNIHSVTKSSYNYNKFLDLMRQVYEYGNDNATKVALVGDQFLAWLGSFADEKSVMGKVDFQMPMASKEFGFNIRNFMHQFGQIQFVRSPLLTQHAGGKYSGYALIVDPMNIGQARYRADKFEAGIQNNDVDGIKDQYFSDKGLALTLPETHHAIKLV
jgi:hypothetical protein